jgi:transketolase
MNKIALRHAVAEALFSIAQVDPRVVVVTSDARGSAGISMFFDQMPERAVEVGIAEQSAVGIAAGLALSGKKAFVFGPACFYSARSFEQIKNDVAYTGSNVKIIGVSGGVSYGPLGSTHHTLHDIALFRATPGIDVILPSDALQAAAIIKMLCEMENPAYLRVGRNPVPLVYDSSKSTFNYGRGVVLRKGQDVVLIATGEVVWHTLEAAGLLAEEGIDATVLDMPFIKPLDEELIIEVASQIQRVVTIEEHSVYGGLGEAVAHCLSELPSVVIRILGIPDEYPVTGTQEEVYRYYGLHAEGIKGAVMDFLGKVG